MTGRSATGTGLDAILLAGGRGSRMGGEAKPLLEVGGRTLLARAVDAARAAGAGRITVVGPVLDTALPVAWVREDPPFAGPAAAVVAGLSAGSGAEWTLLLACDLPEAEAAAALLLASVAVLPADADGVCLTDASSRPQWLTGLYRTASLRRTEEGLPNGGAGLPVRALVDGLALTAIRDPAGSARDVDTWEDLQDARARSAGPGDPHPPHHPKEPA